MLLLLWINGNFDDKQKQNKKKYISLLSHRTTTKLIDCNYPIVVGPFFILYNTYTQMYASMTVKWLKEWNTGEIKICKNYSVT